MAGALSHSMVPLHEVLSHEDALSELQPWGIQNQDDYRKLPQIGIDDPALFDASFPRPEGVSSTWPAEHVVRITRRSAFSGVSLVYRYAVSTSVFGRPRSDLEIDEDDYEEDEDDTFSELGESVKGLVEIDSQAREQERLREVQGISTQAMSDKQLEEFGEIPDDIEDGDFE